MLTAAVVSGPANGTLAFNVGGNGGFVYTPRAGFIGTDTFTYRAGDNQVASNVATVTITVVPPPALDGVRVNGTTAPSATFTASRLTSLTLTFNTGVTVQAGAFRLTNGTHTLTSAAGGGAPRRSAGRPSPSPSPAPPPPGWSSGRWRTGCGR